MTDINVTIGAAKGLAGDNGREIEIQNNGTHIQWRYVGAVSWTNLVALSALTGATGATGIVVKGVYDSLTAYVPNDAVTHNGSFYICILASSGNNPSNVTYWTKYVSKGDTGATGGVNSVNTRQGDVTLAKADVGLSNVDNTSDVNKPISSATQAALNGKSDIGHVHNASVITSGTIDAERMYAYVGTWAGRPSAALYKDGTKAWITDLGLDGCEATSLNGGWYVSSPADASLASKYAHFIYTAGYILNRKNWNPGGRFNIAFVGDSISLGAYGSATAAQWPYLGYVGLLRTALINMGYKDGGEGYINPLRTDAWVKTGTFQTVGGMANSDTCYYATGATNYWTLTTPSECDTFDVWYMRGSGFGAFDVVVDGGSPVTVTPSGSANNERVAYSIHLGSVGIHTIVVKAPASGNIYFLGGAIYKGTTGVVIHNYSKAGESTTGFATQASKRLGTFAVIKPAFTFINLIANDYGSTHLAIATYGTRIADICTQAKLYGDVIGVIPPDNGLAAQTPTLTQYEDEFRSKIIEAGGSCLDIHREWGAYSANLAYMNDTQHPNAAGHTRIKNTLLELVKSIGA